MSLDEKPPLNFCHQQVMVDDISIHIVECGSTLKPPIMFLHGFPENWSSFKPIMSALSNDFYMIAIDLPGIGESGPVSTNDKYNIAKYIRGLIKVLKLGDVTLVGHDVGGMIVYACIYLFPDDLARAVIMNVAIPGIDPWNEVKRNPHIWHFALHMVPELPEILVTGKQKIYFDYFFNMISAKPDKIGEQARLIYAEAYAKPHSLKTGFDWYRAFPQDEKDNLMVKGRQIEKPVLYLRGDREYGNIDTYLNGFREAGFNNIQGRIIADSGHYTPDEQPVEVAAAIKEFIKNSDII